MTNDNIHDMDEDDMQEVVLAMADALHLRMQCLQLAARYAQTPADVMAVAEGFFGFVMSPGDDDEADGELH